MGSRAHSSGMSAAGRGTPRRAPAPPRTVSRPGAGTGHRLDRPWCGAHTRLMTSPRAAIRGLRPEAALGWGAAAAAVLVVYVVVVLGGGVLIGQTDSPHLGLSVLATAVVAAVAEPIR